ncbi:hypothetical protein EI94DRAFT_375706 [Lactarius quietus]|nr:hypothetical protein EI94DRAFT_375706 [Lactarius quietus]
MAVCQFFLRGSCKFGDQCRNEHPQGGQGDRRSALGGSSWTPSNPPKTIPFSLETMTKDFDVRADKPSWSLSSYGPAKNEKNLLPPLDESPEELRLKAVTAMRSGNINEYLQYEQNALAKAEQIFSNARNDIKGAFEAAKRQSLGTDAPSNTTSAFTGTAPGSGSAFSAGGVSAFGNPSVFGAQNSASTSPFGQPQGTSAFGASAFGAPAFGQPPVPKSNFGAAPTNSGGFSAFAGPGPSAFATAANNPSAATGSVFGQSAFSGTGGAQQPQSAIGTANPAPTSSAFGRPGAFGSTAGSVFGQPSPFGVASSPTSAFGQPTSTSTFGQTSTASSNPLTTFGQPAPTPSAFSQPTSAFGQPLAAASTFSQPTRTTSAFGQQAAHTLRLVLQPNNRHSAKLYHRANPRLPLIPKPSPLVPISRTQRQPTSLV